MTARVLSPEEAEEVRRSIPAPAPYPGGPSPLDALLAGNMVHFDDTRSHFNAVRLRRDHGQLLRSRTDGKGGRFYWLEAETPQDQPRRDVR
jgi:hypothetical protein